ncbi:MAG: DNA-protecting protein DprA, partial [Deltaproteobacteria bacterium]|nr:DNA-protecting protein DprA [Deltaproteobacteria bacterium]
MENILPWFALKNVPGIGNHLFKRLIACFNSPENVFEASGEDLLKVKGITPRLITSIKHHKIRDPV